MSILSIYYLFLVFITGHWNYQLQYHQLNVNCAILRRGNPLTWQKSKKYLQHVRHSGIKQFIYHYKNIKDVKTSKFFWGDELEYGILALDKNINSYDIASNRGTELQEELTKNEEKLEDLPYGVLWQPEYGSWMIEAVPRDPYTGYISNLLVVEKSMQLRRKRIHNALKVDEIAPSISNFPLLGVEGLKHSTGYLKNISLETSNIFSKSEYIQDSLTINSHPRFGTLTRNIRSRKGQKVNILVPSESPNAKDIQMDAMAFGMGCNCLQITMQCSSDRESRFIHDQLAILAPIFLALSAATPILKGRLAGTDTRWDIISQSVDDRTLDELGHNEFPSDVDGDMAGGGIKRISKSRYSSVSRFIGKSISKEEQFRLDSLNDISAEFDEEAYKMLRDSNIDENLSKHIAHLFIRDPLVIFDDAIYIDDKIHMDHFENIQSTNWRTIRWKPPAQSIGLELQNRKSNDLQEINLSSPIPSIGNEILKDISNHGPGWRVEFRPLEVQMTDFENAAFAIIVVLLTRSILAMGYNFYLPISYVEENMKRAYLKDAVMTQKFYFRRQAFEDISTSSGSIEDKILVPSMNENEIDIIELSLNDIFNGNKEMKVLGILPAIRNYLDSLNTSDELIDSLFKYFNLISQRASGNLPTAAKWMRSFVKSHHSYQYNKDDSISEEVIKDLLDTCEDIGMGRCQDLINNFLGDLSIHVDKLCLNDSEVYLKSNISRSTPCKDNKIGKDCIDRVIDTLLAATSGRNDENEVYMKSK